MTLLRSTGVRRPFLMFGAVAVTACWLDAPGGILDVDVPTQSVAGIRVVAALLSMDRAQPSPVVATSTTGDVHARPHAQR